MTVLSPVKMVSAPAGARARIGPRYGVVVDAIVGGRTDYKPPASSYDIQVHQSGELVGRARVAVRCGRERTQFGEYFYRCHPVRRQFG